ncbi:type II toxin-antitoxin system HicB family antitoxin [Paenibacillus polymyxa]|uniref:type II toxin-antitoxin system HicB family antitoxin n=1 Tax=Paenibacillus polymyxa TaxID=1406 RepID=UPI00234AA66D|nr:hypothetical protein [Paenibacillus polymyxa]WCM62714.1 hypothetical protein OYT09_07160 [Paenibacillus polymyxa]
MKNRYVYPAIFDYPSEGSDDGISVSFPDLPGAASLRNGSGRRRHSGSFTCT